MNGNDEDVIKGWFEQGELMEVSEAAPYQETNHLRSRVGLVVAAISATALTLVVILAQAL